MKKKFLSLVCCLLLGLGANAENFSYVVNDLNMNNFWQQIGKSQEKAQNVSERLILSNKINKRVPVFVVSQQNSASATTNKITRVIEIHSGLLYCIDNDDELAFVIAHEMAYALETYNGPLSIFVNTTFNAKSYEMKSDLKAIDLMVKAGYNPISGMIILNKVSPEPLSDWGFFSAHPKGSKRLLAMYKYIYKKYPQYLASEKTLNPYFRNFEYIYADELNGFKHKEDLRQKKQLERERI